MANIKNRGRKKKGKTEIKWERIDILLKGASVRRENIITETHYNSNYNFFYPHCSNGIFGAKEYEKIRCPVIQKHLFSSLIIPAIAFGQHFTEAPGMSISELTTTWR